MDKRDLSFLGLLPNEGEKISYLNADLIILSLCAMLVAFCYVVA